MKKRMLKFSRNILADMNEIIKEYKREDVEKFYVKHKILIDFAYSYVINWGNEHDKMLAYKVGIVFTSFNSVLPLRFDGARKDRSN